MIMTVDYTATTLDLPFTKRHRFVVIGSLTMQPDIAKLEARLVDYNYYIRLEVGINSS